MRITSIDHFEAKRLVPYDPNDHAILHQAGEIEIGLAEVKDGFLRLRLRFQFKVEARDDQKLWGHSDVQATCEIRAKEISTDLFSKGHRPELPENVVKLIEGAFKEDIILPMSQLLRAMHLPSPLLSPIDFEELMETGEVHDPVSRLEVKQETL